MLSLWCDVRVVLTHGSECLQRCQVLHFVLVCGSGAADRFVRPGSRWDDQRSLPVLLCLSQGVSERLVSWCCQATRCPPVPYWQSPLAPGPILPAPFPLVVALHHCRCPPFALLLVCFGCSAEVFAEVGACGGRVDRYRSAGGAEEHRSVLASAASV